MEWSIEELTTPGGSGCDILHCNTISPFSIAIGTSMVRPFCSGANNLRRRAWCGSDGLGRCLVVALFCHREKRHFVIPEPPIQSFRGKLFALDSALHGLESRRCRLLGPAEASTCDRGTRFRQQGRPPCCYLAQTVSMVAEWSSCGYGKAWQAESVEGSDWGRRLM